jgi:FkbM family methyltransferase
MLIDAQTGIIHRENTFDVWIIGESRNYFPLGLTSEDVVLDLGGHIGAFAVRAMLECPGITLSAIEAEKSNFDVLQVNATKFGFDANHGAIVADDLDGQPITLYVNNQKNNAAHSILPTRGRSEQATTGIGFTSVLAEFKPTVIKCDIEGGEFLLPWAVVAQAPQIRLVIMELHLLKKGHRDMARGIMAKFLEWGFTCVREPKITEKNWTTLAYWKRNA